MSRFDRYFRALATGYGLLALNIAYSLALVPLALFHLGKEVFGLWALAVQIGAIAQLADAGMTGALNRIFVDYKDDKSSTQYLQTFHTMWLAFTLLGLLVMLLIWLIAPVLTIWLAIPGNLRDSYATFLTAYGAIIGLSFTVKIFPMLLFVHQRSDLLNIIAALGLIIGFGILWYGLESGWGLWSLLFGFATPLLLNNLVCIHQCFRLGYFPTGATGPRLSGKAFMEVFSYGKDRLLITMGFTALQAAPTFLITRLIGLEANAIWAVVSRMNQLCLLLITKISDMSYPVLSEMYVRGEHEVLRRRFSHIVAIGFGGAAICAVGIATCNRDFVRLWTGGRIESTHLLDGLLAVWLLTLILQRLLFLPTSIARDLRRIRHIYLLEALIVGGAGLLALHFVDVIWVVPAVLIISSVMVTIPASFLKSIHVLGSNAARLGSPFYRITLWVIFPGTILAILSHLLPPAPGWQWLLLKGVVATLISLALLAGLPELRAVILESLRRFIPAALLRAR